MSWELKPLGEILEQSGSQRAGSRDLPVLSITMRHGLVDQGDKFKKRVASTDTSNYRIVHKNELVVGFPIDEGVLGFQTKYPAGIVSPAYDIWKLKDESGCHIPYLERFLRSSRARKLYAARMQGAVARRRTLTTADFLEIQVPFPSVDDQVRIAELLGRAESLILTRQRQLQELEDLRTSGFEKICGSTSGATELTIADALRQNLLLLHKDGNHGSNYPRKSEFGATGVAFVTAKSIDDYGRIRSDSIERLNDEKARKLTLGWIEGGDVLLAHNATVGRVGLYNGEFGKALIGTSLTAFRSNKEFLNPIYLYGLLRSPFFQRQLFWGMGQATRNQVPITAQRALRIRVPPLSLQNQFARYAERIDRIRDLYQAGQSDIEQLQGSLSQAAFNGELNTSS